MDTGGYMYMQEEHLCKRNAIVHAAVSLTRVRVAEMEYWGV